MYPIYTVLYLAQPTQRSLFLE